MTAPTVFSHGAGRGSGPGERQSLRARLRDADLYAPPPPSVRRTIRERLEPPPGEGAASAPRPGRFRWLAAAAAVTLLATAPWLVLRDTRRGTADGALAAAALDAHLRSLQLGHLTDVVSTDAHTVKPWFEGKVYARRKHVLSVFVWPAEGAPETASRSDARQGYGWIQWSHSGMQYWVVSDVAPAELEQLTRLLRR